MKKHIKSYFIAILIPLAIGGLSALLTMGNMDIYKEINTPPLSPPSFLFPIVWTILYVLMGISSGMIYNTSVKATDQTKKEKALLTYALSLVFNFGWSLIFFNKRAYFLALVWICVLLFLIAKTIYDYFKINKLAAYLQIPYLIWVFFATYLNIGIAILN